MKKYIAFILILAMCIMVTPNSFALNAAEPNVSAVSVEGKYHPAEIMAALESKDESDPDRQALLNDILLPTSMGITIPKIDPSKVLQTRDVFDLDPAFAEELAAHGIRRTSMTLSEYYALERTWKLPDDFIASAKYVYPELAEVDMREWTYGMYEDYAAQQDRERFLASITPEQMELITARGIQISDLSILMKTYHSIDAILKQSNKSLKAILERAYSFTYDKIEASAENARGYDPGYPYEFVLFPRYNYGEGDYFHVDVLTTDYWRGIQADRALRTQQCLYNSSDTALHCTNMYGTYSYSSEGAHEGIDFTAPSGSRTPQIKAVFSGEVVETGNGMGQLTVFDENFPTVPKNYIFLHMSNISVSVGSTVDVYDVVGQQGDVGAEDNYHVHLEVNPEDEPDPYNQWHDNDLESISPYQLQSYIGELACTVAHTQWSKNTVYHWLDCAHCDYSVPQTRHNFAAGKCIICGQTQLEQNVVDDPTLSE